MVFKHLARIILKNRFLVLTMVGLVTAFMAYNLTSLKFYVEPTPLLPKTDSLLIEHNEFSEIFGKGENMMVIGVKDSSFFTQPNFEHWRKLANDLNQIDGVEHVLSMSEIFNIERDTESRTFKFNKIFDKESYNQNELDSLRKVALSLPFYEDLLYNKEEDIYLMMISIRYEILITMERNQFMKEIVDVCEQYSKNSGNTLRYSGLPYIRISLAMLIEREMYMFILFAILITATILYLLFRSFRIMLFSLLVVAVSVVWGLGFMALVDYDITLLTAVIAPLIIVIGVPNCVYLLNKYHHEYSVHGNKTKALQRVIQKIGSATFLTNLTTAAGFGTFLFTNIRILNEFGLIASVGIMGVFIVSILLIPTIFSLLPPPEPRHLQHLDNPGLKNTITRVILTGLYRRKLVFIISSIIIVLGFIGLARVQSKGYMVDDIPKKHTTYIDLKFFEEHFGGVMPLEIVIDTERPRGILQQGTLSRINQLQERLEKYPELSSPLSVAEAAKFARQGYYNGNPSQYRLPRGPESSFIMSYLPKDMGQNELLERFADSTGRLTRVLYNVADAGSIRIKELRSSINADVDSVFKDNADNVSVTGGSIIYAKGNDYLVRSLLISLVAAIGIISIFMAWMFRKGKMVLLSVLPNLIPLLLTAAAMGFLGIALKPSTVIVFSIAFGISVDNSIHFLAKYRQELTKTNNNLKESVVNAISETGVSMIYTSIVLFFGFGIFIASQFGGTVSLGILVSFTLLVALFSNLIILPSILLSVSRTNESESESLPDNG